MAAFFLGGLAAQDEEMTISSGEVHYNGESILLEGDVSLQNGFGTLSARHLIIYPSMEGNKRTFKRLLLKQNIALHLFEGGKLACQEGEIDYTLLTGRFTGKEEDPDVVYEREGKHRLVLKGCSIQAQFVRLPPKLQKMVLKKLEAEGNVRANYGGFYLLSSDRACYMPISQQEGILSFHMEGSQSYCVLTTSDNDCVQAHHIELNTLNRSLTLFKAQGNYKELSFSADEAYIDDKAQAIKLTGHVCIKQGEEMEIRTEHGAVIQGSLKDGGSISAARETFLTYFDKKNDSHSHIHCPGPFFIDHVQRKALFLCSTSDEQVVFEEESGEMSADRIEFDYDQKTKKLTLAKVILEGNVRIDNRFDGHVKESGTILQQAYADRVVYEPLTQEMLMTAKGENRVRLIDKLNQISMLAPALKISRDLSQKKSKVQGIGEVRFTFSEPAKGQMRKKDQP
jgi:hypothetical protein